jgi:uncharacterized protein YggE
MIKPTQKLLIGLISAMLMLSVVLIGALVFFAVGGSNSPMVSAEAVVPQANSSTPATALQQAAATSPRTITVVGEGKVSIQPDIAKANIGVDIVGGSVSEANGAATSTMEAVMEALKAQGIADKDIQTSGYNIWIERPYGGPEVMGAPGGPGEAIYHVNNTVAVVIRDLESVGEVLNAAIEAGANNIFGVTFSIDDPSELMSEARGLAVQDAEAKAAELASLNQVNVGDVVSISEVIGGGGGVFPSPVARAEAGLGGGGPISPGELELNVQLQITYTIE